MHNVQLCIHTAFEVFLHNTIDHVLRSQLQWQRKPVCVKSKLLSHNYNSDLECMHHAYIGLRQKKPAFGIITNCSLRLSDFQKRLLSARTRRVHLCFGDRSCVTSRVCARDSFFISVKTLGSLFFFLLSACRSRYFSLAVRLFLSLSMCLFLFLSPLYVSPYPFMDFGCIRDYWEGLHAWSPVILGPKSWFARICLFVRRLHSPPNIKKVSDFRRDTKYSAPLYEYQPY